MADGRHDSLVLYEKHDRWGSQLPEKVYVSDYENQVPDFHDSDLCESVEFHDPPVTGVVYGGTLHRLRVLAGSLLAADTVIHVYGVPVFQSLGVVCRCAVRDQQRLP